MKVCRVFLLFLCLAAALGTVSEAGVSEKGDAFAWLRSLKLPEKVTNVLGDGLRKASPRNSQGWVVPDAKAVYVLGAVPVPRDDEPELQVSLEAEALNRSTLKAITLMARHMTQGRLDQRKFADEDATDYALSGYYQVELKGGVQSRSGVFGERALTLLWIDNAVKDRVLAESLPEKRLMASYCERLYRRGSELMESGDYHGALEIFHKIHYLDWANVEAYLDAAECFLKVEKGEDAALLVQELLKTLDPKMTVAETARAARLLFRSGRKDEGFAVLEKACIMAGILTP